MTTTTDRGFAIYGEVTDSRRCTIRVQESSAVGRPHAYLFTDGAPHLSVAQAEELIAALRAFVAHASDPANWRNTDEYMDTFG